jgi:hypothetical protein
MAVGWRSKVNGGYSSRLRRNQLPVSINEEMSKVRVFISNQCQNFICHVLPQDIQDTNAIFVRGIPIGTHNEQIQRYIHLLVT